MVVHKQRAARLQAIVLRQQGVNGRLGLGQQHVGRKNAAIKPIDKRMALLQRACKRRGHVGQVEQPNTLPGLAPQTQCVKQRHRAGDGLQLRANRRQQRLHAGRLDGQALRRLRHHLVKRALTPVKGLPVRMRKNRLA